MRFLFSVLFFLFLLFGSSAALNHPQRFHSMSAGAPVYPTSVAGSIPNTPTSAAPAVQAFNGALYMAVTAAQPGGQGVCILSSTNGGSSWSNCNWILSSGSDHSQNSPSLAVYNGVLYLAITESAPGVSSVGVCIVSSSDGSHWSSGCNWVLGSYVAAGGPTLTVHSNLLYMIFGSSSNNGFCVSSSSDGSTWSSCNWIQTQTSGIQPTIFSLNNTLYVSWAQNSNLSMSIAQDGSSYSTAQQIFSSWTSNSTPSIAFWGGLFYYAFAGTNGQLYVAQQFNSPVAVLSSYTLQSGTGPNLLANGNQLVIVFSDQHQVVYSAIIS